MKAIEPAELILALIVAYWAGTNVVFTGVKAANEARDKMIAGRIGEKLLSRKDMSTIFWFDWLPIVIGLAAISAVLGIVLIALPKFIHSGDVFLGDERGKFKSFEMLCYIASIVPWSGAAWFLFRTIAEYRMLSPLTREQKKQMKS